MQITCALLDNFGLFLCKKCKKNKKNDIKYAVDCRIIEKYLWVSKKIPIFAQNL